MVAEPKYKIDWSETTMGLTCSCGAEVILDEQSDPTVCECGRKYTLWSSLTVQMPRGRCQAPGCSNWVHSSQPSAIYCSTACTEKGGYAKGRARRLAKRAADGG